MPSNPLITSVLYCKKNYQEHLPIVTCLSSRFNLNQLPLAKFVRAEFRAQNPTSMGFMLSGINMTKSKFLKFTSDPIQGKQCKGLTYLYLKIYLIDISCYPI